MDNQISFVLKVLLASAGLAFAIRYLAPALAIPATPTNALVAVLLPSVLLSIGLGWRSTRKPISKPKKPLQKTQEGKI